MPRVCPDCQVPLQARDFQGVTIDACPKCAGIFFDDGEVAKIKAKGLDSFDALEDAVVPTIDPDPDLKDRHRVCPNCSVTMDKFRYMYSSNLMLDECERCGGIWVQDGELRRMREVLEEQGISKSRPGAVSVSSASNKPAVGYSDRLRKVQQFITGVGRAGAR